MYCLCIVYVLLTWLTAALARGLCVSASHRSSCVYVAVRRFQAPRMVEAAERDGSMCLCVASGGHFGGGGDGVGEQALFCVPVGHSIPSTCKGTTTVHG